MANRIQLRRDTAANWTRVNPVLEDGEPGLEIDTNRVKYGDGNTTWANLSYSGGGSASFDYSTVQEGSFGPNNLTSITGGDDTGVSLTSENWAQLMWVPDTATVTIEDIGDGPATYTWAFVDDEGFHVAASVDEVNRDWRFTTNGNLELPLGGKIGEVPSPTFVGNAVVITPADGTDDNQQLMIYPTQNEGNHLHLTSGNLAVTDIFLGNDDQYIRTRTDQGMTIGTNGGEINNGWAWTFGANAVLSVPFEGLIRATDDSISLQTYDTTANVTHAVRLGTGGQLFLENKEDNVQWLQVDTFMGNTRFQSNGGASIKTDSGGSEWSWLFANTGVLTTPGNVQIGTAGTYGNISFVDTVTANTYVVATGRVTGNLTVGNLVVNGNSSIINTESYVVEDNIIQMANANPADTLDLGFVAHRTVDGNLQHTGLIRDASAGYWRLFSNVVPQPGNTVDFTNAVYDSLIIGGLGTTSISLTGPLNFTASPPAYSTPGIQWNSGWQGDIYGNTQVANYLANFNGNITTGNISSINGFFWSNGAPYVPSVQADTGNVTFTDTTISTAGGAGQGIILNSAGAGEIAMLDYVGINNTNPGYWLHVGDGSVGAVNNTGNISIDYNNGLDSSRAATILGYAWWDTGGNGNNNRGIGAHRQFGIYKNDDLYTTKYIEFDLTSGNANLTNIAVSRVTTTNGIFWANGAAFASSNYGNTEVAAYLPGYNGILRGASLNTANAVISGGYISALTNVTVTTGNTGSWYAATINSTSGNITTLAATNFSTANAVVTGGYAIGLANISVTGNATVGNVIGTSPNVTLIAGAYTSSFLNNGMATIGGNVTVSANVSASGIAPFYAPNRPAFRIIGNGGAISATTTVSGGYMVVDYNQGSYLNTTNGIFTAPVAGLYQVNIVVRTNTNSGPSSQIIIRKTAISGGAVTSQIMVEFAANTTMNHTGGSTIVKMEAGDTLKFDVTVGTISFDGNDNWSVAYIG